jgi:hypothetical protein
VVHASVADCVAIVDEAKVVSLWTVCGSHLQSDVSKNRVAIVLEASVVGREYVWNVHTSSMRQARIGSANVVVVAGSVGDVYASQAGGVRMRP